MSFRFVQPDVLNRLYQGHFVPQRQALGTASSSDNGERRRWVSPLALAKRCIRYEPRVFETWTPQVLHLANQLNDPSIQIITLVGPEGCGKTALMRGAVELMGGGPEQLIWYDALPQSDPSQCLMGLLDSLTYLAEALVPEAMARFPQLGILPPLEQVPPLLDALQAIPLLVVLDQVDTLTSPTGQWRSPLVREAVTQLLTAPNVKLALVGEQVPTADLQPWRQATADNSPPRLNETAIRTLLQTPQPHAVRSVIDEDLIQLLALRMEGAPWLIRSMMTIGQFSSVNLEALKQALNSAPPGELATANALITFLWPRLAPDEQSLLGWLGLIRHPLGNAAFQSLLPALDVTLLGHFNKGHIQRGSLLRALVRQRLTPQAVLQTLHQPARTLRQSNSTDDGAAGLIDPWIGLYRPIRQGIEALLPPELKGPRHQVLAQFYHEEGALPPGHRLSQGDTGFLKQEQTWHQNQSPILADESVGLAPLPSDFLAHTTGLTAPPPPPPQPTGSDSAMATTNEGAKLESSNQPVIPALASSPLVWASKTTASTQTTHALPHALQGVTLAPVIHPIRDRQPPTVTHQHSSITLTLAPWDEEKPPEAIPSTEPNSDSTDRSHLPTPDKAFLQPEVPSFFRAYRQARRRHQLGHQLQALLILAQHWQALYPLGPHRAEKLAKCAAKVNALLPHLPPYGKAAHYTLQGDYCVATHQLSAAQTWYTAAWVLLPPQATSPLTLPITLADTICQYLRLTSALALGQLAHWCHEQPERATHWLRLAYQQATQPHTTLTPTQQAQAVFMWATQHERNGDPNAALPLYQEALSLDQAAGHVGGCAATLANIARLHHQAGDWEAAETHWAHSLALDESIGNLSGQLHTLEALTVLHFDQQQPHQAQAIAGQWADRAETAQHAESWMKAQLWRATLAQAEAETAPHPTKQGHDFQAALGYYALIQQHTSWARLSPGSQALVLRQQAACQAHYQEAIQP